MIKLNLHSFNLGIISLCITLILSLFFTAHSNMITESAKSALELCAVSVIPSLFPFMVLSSLASKAAATASYKHSLKTIILIPVILGALCGFPVGAATAAMLYKNGSLQKRDTEYLCAFCNNTGPAFIIGVFGNSFWGSAALGIMFYICQLLSAAIVFGVCIFIFVIRRDPLFSANVKNRQEERESCSPPLYLDRFCREFCTSVTSSAVSVVQICGYIVFFRVICDMVKHMIPTSSGIVYTVIAALLEFTSGSAAASEVGGLLGIGLCGFAIGFAGLSVMAQSAGLLSNACLSAVPMLWLKLIIGLVNGVLCIITYSAFDLTEPAFSGIHNIQYSPTPIVSLIILTCSAVSFVIIKTQRFTGQ